MKNVLFIANQFPPMGGSGVQRTAKFVKYLGLYGYAPVVLTRNAENISLRDDTLLGDIPEGTPIIRTKAYDFTNLGGLLKLPGKLFARKVLIPDAERLWAEKSLGTAFEAIEKHDIHLIYSTSYPYSDHLLALKIKKKRPDIKWVCDFRDEWTNNPYVLDKPYGKRRTRIEKDMEADVLAAADAVISNTPVMVQNFIKLRCTDGKKFHTIPNGYDADDFASIPEKSEANSRFTLVYTGALYGRRKPDTFFEALSRLIAAGEVERENINVKLIGNYYEERLGIDKYGLRDVVDVVPYMPHGKSIQALAAADCLLLIEGAGRGAEAFYTGKIFEYMMAKTPVLAIIPEKGAAATLVVETGIGNVCDFSNIDAIMDGFMIYYSSWKNRVSSYSPNYGEIAKYERKELTKKLASVFDDVLRA